MKFVQGFYRLGILSTRLEKLIPLFDSSVVIGTRQSQFHEADPFHLLYWFLTLYYQSQKSWLIFNQWRRHKNTIMFFALFDYIRRNTFLYISNLISVVLTPLRTMSVIVLEIVLEIWNWLFWQTINYDVIIFHSLIQE